MRNIRNRFLTFINQWKKIFFNYDSDLKKLNDRISELEKFVTEKTNKISELERYIKERTNISVDMNLRREDYNTIIVIGSYKNKDYIQTYHIRDLNEFVDYLERLRQYGSLRTIDCPPQMKYIIDHENSTKNRN
ncbi:MAG: hypothetical protein WC679_01225 [Bacteroidales bacterium]|jgi:hypothetical protein